MLGVAYMLTGNYAEAEKAFKEPIRRGSMVIPCIARLAMLQVLQNDVEEARLYVTKLLELRPNYTLQDWARVPQYRQEEDLERESSLLRKAGLPERVVDQ